MVTLDFICFYLSGFSAEMNVYKRKNRIRNVVICSFCFDHEKMTLVIAPVVN